jgi:hypothetical protein
MLIDECWEDSNDMQTLHDVNEEPLSASAATTLLQKHQNQSHCSEVAFESLTVIKYQHEIILTIAIYDPLTVQGDVFYPGGYILEPILAKRRPQNFLFYRYVDT